MKKIAKMLALLAAMAMLALAGCKNASYSVPLPTYTGNGSENERVMGMVIEVGDDIHLSDTDVNFGEVVLGKSETRIIALKNGGENALMLAVSLISQESGVFSVSGDGIDEEGNITVGGGTQKVITVAYEPKKVGDQRAKLSIKPKDSKTFVLNLKGNAPTPTAKLAGAAVMLWAGKKKQATATVSLDNGIFVEEIFPSHFELTPSNGIESIFDVMVYRINERTATISFTVKVKEDAASDEDGAISAKISSDALKLYDKDVKPEGAFAYRIAQYEIGDTGPGGGYVFYLSATGFTVNGKECHYLECSSEQVKQENEDGNEKERGTWCSCNYSSDYCDVATEEGIGAGYTNTQAILETNHPGGEVTVENCAAKACAEYDNGTNTKGEWFLPSKDELNEIYRVLVKTQDGELGAITSNDWTYFRHWSSSQDSYNHAWCQDLNDGYQGDYFKHYDYCVRAVRAF